MSAVTAESTRPGGGFDNVGPEIEPSKALVSVALRAMPKPVARPAHWRIVAGGMFAAAPGTLVADRIGGADAILAAAMTLVVWTVLAAVHEFSGATREPSALARSSRLGRRAARVAAVLAVAGVGGLLSLGSVRGAIPALCLATLGSVLVDLAQARRAAPQRLVLVGARYDMESYAARLAGNRSILLVGACVVAPERRLSTVSPLMVPTVRSLDEIAGLASNVRADTVVVVPGLCVGVDDVRRLTWIFERLPVTLSIAAPIAAVAHHRMRPRSVGDETVIDLAVPRAAVASRMGKIILDRAGALVLLLLTLPVLLAMWVAVRLDSPGPGLFAQTRIGRDGVPFKMYKLRSMHTDAEAQLTELVAENEMDSTTFKIRRDPRVTRIGYLLRRSSVDELPQLWNVLRGDMSLIGPRPGLPAEVATYDEAELRRLTVLPGITGLWQVSGRSDLTWEQSVRLDLYYADNWRLLDDLAIAARTVKVVAQARGAY